MVGRHLLGACGARFMIDAHRDAFERGRWSRPRWLDGLVARRAEATLVNDSSGLNGCADGGAGAVVIPDGRLTIAPRRPQEEFTSNYPWSCS